MAVSREAISRGTTAIPRTTCTRCNWRCAKTCTWTSGRRTLIGMSWPAASSQCWRKWLAPRFPPAGPCMDTEQQCYLAPAAWVNGRWVQDVLLAVDDDGLWSGIIPDAPAQMRRGAQRLSGPVLPGLVNGHSHAFQRAIAGLTERSGGDNDDFWSWRDRMYSVANRVTPEQLEAIAAFLYSELLQAGYTHVCEFHYLHNGIDGQAYADPLEMSFALVRAAQRTGIGVTLLPALYMRSGFGTTGLREDQRRFASTPNSILHIAQAVARHGGRVSAGVAVH